MIIPNLGEDKSRLLIAINQADVAMKGRYWNYETNQPEPKLIEFLDEKVASTKARIKEATGVNVEPIYYSAGFKDGNDAQQPWNLAKLLSHILKHTDGKKRIVFASEINTNPDVWTDNDKLKDYQEEVKKDFIESFIANIAQGVGKAVEVVGNIAYGVVDGLISGAKAVGKVVGSAIGAITRFFW